MKETVDYHIKATWHGIARMYNQIAMKYEISQAVGFVLLNIDKDEGSPATRIAPLLGMESTSMTRMLNRMEKEELIFRRRDVNDGRMVRIFLTEKGEEKRIIAKRVVSDFNQLVEDLVPQKKMGIFFEVMHKINESIDEFKKIETA